MRVDVWIGVGLLTLAIGEPALALVHRYAFHGPLWCWHKSHHEHPTARRLVTNDLLWLPPLVIGAGLVVAGVTTRALGGGVLAGVGSGVIGYTAAYVVAHDGVAHGRFWTPAFLKRLTFVRRLVSAHHAHHAGGVNGVGAPPFAVYAGHLERRRGWSRNYAPPTHRCSSDHSS